MKPKYFYTLHKTTPMYGYNRLTLSFYGNDRLDRGTDRYPVPVMDHDHSQAVEITWQSNADSPTDWYGMKVSFSQDGGRCIWSTPALYNTLRRFLKDCANQSPAEVLAAMGKAKVPQGIYSSVFYHFIPRAQWDRANEYYLWIDRGISTKKGSCTVNAYTIGNTHVEGVQAVANALRQSRHCSDQEFVDWMNNGSQVEMRQGPKAQEELDAVVFDHTAILPQPQEMEMEGEQAVAA